MSEDTLQTPEKNYGPGNVLRAKREEYEWSVEAVAEALHLSTHAVKALEADRYEDLPGATYVIGYWRSYARLLGIDIEETIEVNKRNLNIVTAEPAGMDINRAFGQKTKSGGKGGLLLLVLLAAFAYYAWQQQFFGLLDNYLGDEEPAIQVLPADQTPEVVPAASLPDQEQQVLRPLKEEQVVASGSRAASSDTGSNDPDNNKGTQIVGTQTDSGLILPPADSAQSTRAVAPQAGGQAGLILAPAVVPDASPAGTPVAQAQSSVATVVNVEPASTAAVAELAPQSGTSVADAAGGSLSTAQIASGMETMTLTLSKDSWLDVRDKSRTRLLYKTEKAGQTVEVSGVPPFYIYIGTPDGVSIRYKGKNVPFQTHKTGMFARFKLDDETLEAL